MKNIIEKICMWLIKRFYKIEIIIVKIEVTEKFLIDAKLELENFESFILREISERFMTELKKHMTINSKEYLTKPVTMYFSKIMLLKKRKENNEDSAISNY